MVLSVFDTYTIFVWKAATGHLESVQKVQRFPEKEIRDHFLSDPPHPPLKGNRGIVENSTLLENNGSISWLCLL